MPRQAIIQPSTEAIEIIDTPIPTAKDKDVVIKVVVAGTNPKDWKYPLWKKWPHNSGDDIAGIVHAVGKDVYEFKPGDRVAALHQSFTSDGAYAEKCDNSCCGVDGGIGVIRRHELPTPFALAASENGKGNVPLLIYGVTSAVGAFAAKLARLSGVHPIIGVAGRAREFAESLVDHVVDYRQSEDSLVAAIEDIFTEEGLDTGIPYVVDAISEGTSFEVTRRVVNSQGGVVCTVLPPKLFAKDGQKFEFPSGVIAYNTVCPFVHSTHQDFGHIWSRFLGRLLEDGRLMPHPHEVVPGGLIGVLAALQKLRDGTASGVKYVCRLEETAVGFGLFQADGKEIAVGTDLGLDGENTHPLRNFPYPA